MHKNRKKKLMPDGVPRWIRVYDNGGGLKRFCRGCLLFTDEEGCCDRPTIQNGNGVDQTGTFDRYTAVFTGRYAGRQPNTSQYVGMSARPFHPQGFGQHGEHNGVFDTNDAGFAPKVGDRAYWGYGRRITFAQLPSDCQKLVVSDYKELWNLES